MGRGCENVIEIVFFVLWGCKSVIEIWQENSWMDSTTGCYLTSLTPYINEWKKKLYVYFFQLLGRLVQPQLSKIWTLKEKGIARLGPAQYNWKLKKSLFLYITSATFCLVYSNISNYQNMNIWSNRIYMDAELKN